MTFSIDTCIIIAIANKFDAHHEISKKLLKERTDQMVILFAIMNEAASTFIRKFNTASKKIYSILQKTKNSSDFPKMFKQEFEKMVVGESEKKKNISNFYKYVYSLIEIYVKNRNFKEIADLFQNYPIDIVNLIPIKLKSLKDIEDTIFPDKDMWHVKTCIEPIISHLSFPKSYDKEHFLMLCVYSRDNSLDYFTKDSRYYLRMIESLNLIKTDKSFKNVGIVPHFLTETYFTSLH